jgi:acyl-CoA synthetase (NDP forming)
MKHRLEPLLNPASIAVLGATERAGSAGRRIIENLLHGGFRGRLYAVNPGYESVLGVACFADLPSLPEPVEHVFFAISDARVEAALDAVIAHGARAVTILSSLVLEQDSEPKLLQRVGQKIRAAGLLACGANSMGFYNFHEGVWACGFDTRDNHVRGGNVTLISQSGSGMSGIVDCEERIDFNLAISTGQELSVSLDEYLDYALEQPATRVVGMFVESVRNPPGMIAALEKAAAKKIPIVVIKVGRTEFAARMAITHSGAIAGTDAAYQALFERYGVQRVNDMDALSTALILFAQPHPVGPGGLVAIHDSGGERQLLIDLADQINVPLAKICPATEKQLAACLDPGLPPVNPLDAWGRGGPDADQVMADCFTALLADEEAALGAVVHDRAPRGAIYPEYLEYIAQAHRETGKPAVLIANHQGTGRDEQVLASTRRGFPVIDGLRSFLRAVSCVFSYRDFCLRQQPEVPKGEAGTLQKWTDRLAGGATLDESESLAMLADFGLPANAAIRVEDEAELIQTAGKLGYPLVLKTACAGINHKTESGGVVLGIDSEASLLKAWREMLARLGPKILISPMVTATGVEMVLGMVRDEQFGPLVLLGFGGVDVEALNDVAYALPPFDAATARRLLDSLKLQPLLAGGKRRPAPASDAFCETAARFSILVAGLADVLAEIDINPIIVHEDGCVAVDALVVGRAVSNRIDENRRAG